MPSGPTVLPPAQLNEHCMLAIYSLSVLRHWLFVDCMGHVGAAAFSSSQVSWLWSISCMARVTCSNLWPYLTVASWSWTFTMYIEPIQKIKTLHNSITSCCHHPPSWVDRPYLLFWTHNCKAFASLEDGMTGVVSIRHKLSDVMISDCVSWVVIRTQIVMDRKSLNPDSLP